MTEARGKYQPMGGMPIPAYQELGVEKREG